MKNKLLVLTRHQEKARKAFESFKLSNLDIYAPESDEDIKKILPEANIIYGVPWLVKQYLNKANKLVWVQSAFTGVDDLIDKNLRKDYLLTNIRDAFSEIMAEYVFAYVLMFEKEILSNLSLQHEQIWGQKPYIPLKARTIGVLGTGSIGREIARVAKTFGMKVLGLRASNNDTINNFDEIYTQENINHVLANSDYLVSALPSTTTTRSSLDKEVFNQMKDTAIFINVGRGDVLVASDLITALNNKKIRAAVLDVFKEEPLPKESPLWKTKNLYITPHISGYIESDYDNSYNIFKENYNRFISNQDLLYRVDFEKGY